MCFGGLEADTTNTAMNVAHLHSLVIELNNILGKDGQFESSTLEEFKSWSDRNDSSSVGID